MQAVGRRPFLVACRWPMLILLLVLPGAVLAAESPVPPSPPQPVPSAPATLPLDDSNPWRQSGPADVGAPVALTVVPEEAGSRGSWIYLAAPEALYQSRNGGQAWSMTPFSGLIAFAAHPDRPRTLYVLTTPQALTTPSSLTTGPEGLSLRVWRSDDGGVVWRSPGAVEADLGRSAGVRFVDLALDPRRPDVLYVLTAGSDTTAGSETDSAPATLWVSRDGGRSWRQRSKVVPAPEAGISPTEGRGLADPSQPTTASGATAEPPTVASRGLVVAQGERLYVATQSGVLRSDDGGGTWRWARTGLEASGPAKRSPAATHPATELGAEAPVDPSAEVRTEPTFKAISPLSLQSDHGDRLWAAVSPDPESPQSPRLYQSVDGGDTWQPVAAPLPPGQIDALTLDPDDRRNLWLSVAGAGVHAHDGRTWRSLPPLPGDDDPGPFLLAAPGDPSTAVWVADAGGRLFRHSSPRLRCDAGPATLCLAGRFQIQVDYQAGWSEATPRAVGGADDSLAPPPLPAQAVPLTPTGGWFWFQEPGRPEVVVRVTRAEGPDQSSTGSGPGPAGWRVFATSLTEAPFALRVLDVASGRTAGLGSGPGAGAFGGGGSDEDTLVTDFADLGGNATSGLWFAALPEGGCDDESIDLCLHDGRFEIAADWRIDEDPSGGSPSGAAIGDLLSDEAGWFRFLHPDEPELFVRLVEDSSNPEHWALTFGSLTNLGFDLTVTDRASGEIVQYQASPGGPARHHDPSAFTPSPHP